MKGERNMHEWITQHMEAALMGIAVLLLAAFVMTVLVFRTMHRRKSGLEEEIQEGKDM